MICWTERSAPADGSSRKWFYVRVVTGALAGSEGYVWSDLVADQTKVSNCENVSFPLQGSHASSPQIELQAGHAAKHGFRYDVQLRNFPANSVVQVQCFDTLDPGGFYTFTLRPLVRLRLDSIGVLLRRWARALGAGRRRAVQ